MCMLFWIFIDTAAHHNKHDFNLGLKMEIGNLLKKKI